MKSHPLALVASLAIIPMAVTAAPRLVVSTPTLVPESKIDLVLDHPAAETTELGKTVENTWLDIKPALPGKLRWKAQNIAEFLPDHPPALGATYTFSIPKDRKHLDASAVPDGKFATLAAEEFRIITSHSPNRWSDDYSASTATWTLVFNDEIDPAAAAAFVSFANPAGQRVAAKLEQSTVGRAGYYATHYKPWAARWGNATAPADTPENLAPHVLLATPVSPLPPGKNWHLSVLKGLPNRAATARLAADTAQAVGDIEPFHVRNIEARVVADEPRGIVIQFNHPLPEKLPEDFLTACLDIEPRPESLQAVVQRRELVITGALAEKDRYHVTLKPPFTSRDGLQLESARSKFLVFEHLEPELALPSDNQAQLAHGSRNYRVHTVNLTRLHVRVKKLGGSDLIRSYQGYRHYTGTGPDGKSISPTSPLPWPLIAGETVFDKEIPIAKDIDTSEEITLKWDEILPKEMRNAALFIDITGTPQAAAKNSGRRNAQAIVQLTDIGLAWKLTPKEALVYAFSCHTGAPLAGVKIGVFGEDAAPLHEAVTDAAGLASLPRTEEARHLVASQGMDAYLTAFDATLPTVGLWHFPIRYSWNTPAESSRQAFLFTDRSLYRPGETVRLKGIVRTLRGNAVEAAQAQPARLLILDPTEKEILRQDVALSANGSFDFTHTLAPSKTGTHIVRLEFPGELAKIPAGDDGEMNWEERERILENARFDLPLRVEEFRRNAFEITQSIAPPAIGASQVTANLGAKYYQGQPVAAGNVKHYSRVTTKNLYPERFRDFYFGNHRSYDWGYWYHYFGYRGDDEESSTTHSANLQGETQLAADGTAAVTVDIPQTEFPSPREVEISTEVTDANHQTLTARSTATVHSSEVYVGISRVDKLARVGEALPFRIAAIDTEERPYAQPLKLTATLTREVNSAVKTRADDGSTATRNDVSEETVITNEFTLDPANSAKEGQELIITPQANGLHFLSIRGTDSGGRPFATVTRLYVYGSQEYPWQYEDGLRVKLVGEKKSWKPGETARVLVLSPIEGTALVTVEREKVLRSFQVQLKADNPVIEIPLTDDDAPNAYVSVLIVKGARESAREHKEPQLRLGYCELLVDNQRDKLAVAIDAPSESYRPGETVTLAGSVAGADGKPAAGAEVTFYAEDEGTLAVMGYETPDPLAFFYQPRILGVESGISFEAFLAEDPASQDFHNKGFFVGGGGDMDQLAELLRKNFDPCATWAPALVTDEAGRFSHTFKLPDTLTRYRVIAVAHQGAARFGRAESAIIAKKDLMLEPKSPRFANQTDTFNPQVLVQNASRFAGTWKVEYRAHAADGTPLCRALGHTEETVSLAPGASATLVFPTLAENTGEAVLAWKATPVSLQNGVLDEALALRLSDSVENRFQIHYPMPLIRQVKFVKLNQPGVAEDLRKAMDPNLLDGTGSLDLEFSRSPLADAAGSVDYLLHYPYGCVEQTTSSTIPWCAVSQLKGVIPSFTQMPDGHVKAAIQAGADRLLSMQLPDGGFSYWPGVTQEAAWATPYAGMGLILASNAGANVPPSAIESLTQKLIASLRGMAECKSAWGLETHARTLFTLALAGKPQPAYQSAMIDRMGQLSPQARAMLAAAIARGNPAEAATAREIMTSKVSFDLKHDGWMDWSAENASQLLAWTFIDSAGPEATAAVDRMLNDRNPYGHWRTTWVNGWSLVALGYFAEHEKNRGESVAIQLETSDGVQGIQLSNETPVATRSLKLGPNLKLLANADHNAFVRLRLASKPPVTPIQPVATNGLSIDRIHHLVKPDGSTEVLTEPKPGDLIRVTLRVTLPNDDTRYLVIEDMLPSIFETVNQDFASQSSGLGVRTSENDWNVSHSELRADRAVFFLDHVWRRGTYHVTYLARCTLAGRATAPPAKVEGMYNPDHFALSASRVFTAK